MGPKYEVKYFSKFYFLKKKIPNFKLEKMFFFSFFSKGFTAEKIWIKKKKFWKKILKKICERRFFFINRHVKHTFVHYEYVEVPLGLAKHIAGQDLMHRPLPADIIWLEFGSFSNFLRESLVLFKKWPIWPADGRVADFIWTVWTFSVEKNLNSRVASKTRWDNAIFVTDLLPEN